MNQDTLDTSNLRWSYFCTPSLLHIAHGEHTAVVNMQDPHLLWWLMSMLMNRPADLATLLHEKYESSALVGTSPYTVEVMAAGDTLWETLEAFVDPTEACAFLAQQWMNEALKQQKGLLPSLDKEMFLCKMRVVDQNQQELFLLDSQLIKDAHATTERKPQPDQHHDNPESSFF